MLGYAFKEDWLWTGLGDIPVVTWLDSLRLTNMSSPPTSIKRSWNCITTDSSCSIDKVGSTHTLRKSVNNLVSEPNEPPFPACDWSSRSSNPSPVVALRHAAINLLIPAAAVATSAQSSSSSFSSSPKLMISTNITTQSTDSGLDDYDQGESETALSSPSAVSRSSQDMDEVEENLLQASLLQKIPSR